MTPTPRSGGLGSVQGRTVAVSRPERRTEPGSAPVGALSATVSTPFTRTRDDAVGAGRETGCIAG